MKIKYVFTLAVALTCIITTTSCSDSYLDEKVYSSYVPGNTDIKTIEAQLVGLHRTFASIWGWSSNQGFVACFQTGTDVASAGDEQGVERPFHQYAELNNENDGVSFLWQEMYEIINNANLIVSALGENPSGQQIQEAAEARFFRAYAYNMLVTLWGDVPLVTSSTAVPRTDYTRQPITDVDKQIEEDLNYAMDNLPAVGKAVHESRANKDFARMLAGEAFLRMGMRDASYYKKAETAIDPVITEGNYKLISARYGKFLGEGGDYYHDMFRWGNERRSQGNTEGIWTFEMEYNRDVIGGTIDNPQQRRIWQPALHKYSGMQNCDSLGGRGNGRLRLSNFIKYGLYEKGDIRNSNYNIRRVFYYNKPGYSEEIGIDKDGFKVDKNSPDAVKKITLKTGDRVIVGRGDSLNVCYPYTTKWGGYDTTDDFGYALVKDWPIMRFAEAYLLRAEARMRQGNNDGAAADINVLRDRAFKDYRIQTGNVSAGKVNASQINIDFILDERARELVGEENRRVTLCRTNTLAERILKNGDVVPAAPESKVITGFQSFNSLLPIPLSIIQLNKDAVITQNEGYGK
ncbi:RagB/SusD family nutrient uptake outer membrane protein [Xylanibacter oryzae]|uniref:RagB/SusD family nutrient uptake outer membrane protein n=1 Tax=Xylanibacter oryzae TaxID=185293 RepID=UPI0004AF9A46|nr:RagB/SusD family nutrient uptake outer membrane protein [Xylanibacter oryzae]